MLLILKGWIRRFANATKGAHTLIEALANLKRHNYSVQITLAGDVFQPSYKSDICNFLAHNNLSDCVNFVGQLDRIKLPRFWDLHHLGVFASIYPEAFGISAAEIMASGSLLLTSGVGGAAELIEPSVLGGCLHLTIPKSLKCNYVSLKAGPDL